MEPLHADWFRQYKYDSFCMQSLQRAEMLRDWDVVAIKTVEFT